MSKNPQEIPKAPGLQYPTNLDKLLHGDVVRVVRNIYDNLFHLSSLANKAAPTSSVVQASTFGLSGPHSKRPPARLIQKNDTYYETDRTVSYINLYRIPLLTITAYWRYEFGEMVAVLTSRPTDLGFNDAGFLFRDQTTQDQYRWDGSAWLLIVLPIEQIIFTNGAPITATQGQVNFNDVLPAPPGGKVNVKWQQSGAGPNSISAYIDAAASTQTVYFGIHATRIAFYPPADYTDKWFIETDRLSVYVSDGTNWNYVTTYLSGPFGTLAVKPTDLGAFDTGFLYQSTDFYRSYIWTGSGWVDASGQPDRGYVEWRIQAPSHVGYQLCDGSGCTMSTFTGGTVFTSAPNLIGAYVHGAIGYDGPFQTAAVAPTLTGLVSFDLTHLHEISHLWSGTAYDDDHISQWLHDLTLVGSTGAPKDSLGSGDPWLPTTTVAGAHDHSGSNMPAGSIDHFHTLFSVYTDFNIETHDHDFTFSGLAVHTTSGLGPFGVSQPVINSIDSVASFTDTESNPHTHPLLGSTDTANFGDILLDIVTGGSHTHSLTESESEHFHSVFVGGTSTPVPLHVHEIEGETATALGVIDIDGEDFIVSDTGRPPTVGMLPYMRL